MTLNQIAIFKDGEHIANVPSPAISNKPVRVPFVVWQIIVFWARGANYAPKYKGYTWEWHK